MRSIPIRLVVVLAVAHPPVAHALEPLPLCSHEAALRGRLRPTEIYATITVLGDATPAAGAGCDRVLPYDDDLVDMLGDGEPARDAGCLNLVAYQVGAPECARWIVEDSPVLRLMPGDVPLPTETGWALRCDLAPGDYTIVAAGGATTPAAIRAGATTRVAVPVDPPDRARTARVRIDAVGADQPALRVGDEVDVFTDPASEFLDEPLPAGARLDVALWRLADDRWWVAGCSSHPHVDAAPVVPPPPAGGCAHCGAAAEPPSLALLALVALGLRRRGQRTSNAV